MKFPESWLRAWCNPPLDTQGLANVLTMGGFEVESVTPVAPPFDGVVVGRIVGVEPHPNADKLRVCSVDVGAAAAASLPLQIVCGAPNARIGIRVPVALVGARLPPATPEATTFEIKAATLRGVASSGMLCSARELGLSTDHAGLLELDVAMAPGQDLRAAMRLDDHVFELKLTPNLGHALSVYGVARELSALTGAPLAATSFAPVTVTSDARQPVRIEATDLCGRFTGRVIAGVDARAPTPAWMVERLARCGQRSVNALVDISNYVMFEFGRPSHIFDRGAIDGTLVVRWGREGESLTLLNGQDVEVDESVGVIAVASGGTEAQRVESLAGIMGGQSTATTDDTTAVYVEAAYWYPAAVAGRSRRYGFATDAGHRFERGVDPSTTLLHVEHITGLVLDICGGAAGPLDDQQPAVPSSPAVTMRVARAAKVIGMPISQTTAAGVMTRLGFEFTQGEGTVCVTPPPWRFDLRIEEDLIEEVARLVGYDALPDTPPVSTITPLAQPEAQRSVHGVRHRLAALGYQETINFSFVDEATELALAGNANPVRVVNPMAAPMSVMRSSLLGGLVATLGRNVAHRADRAWLFEVGRVFRRDDTVVDGERTVAGVDQPLHVAGLAWGLQAPSQWSTPERDVDFFDVKGDVEALFAPQAVTFEAASHPALHPGRCARVKMHDKTVGWIGELHPRWRQQQGLSTAPVVFELHLRALTPRHVPVTATVARQQPMWRDLALVARDTVTHDALMHVVRREGGSLLQHAHVFDVYRPQVTTGDIAADERSLAVRLELHDDAAPLTDVRADSAAAAIVAALSRELGARLRG